MNTQEMINVLRSEAKSNPASNAAFCMLALRKRTRNTIGLSSLARRMKQEGFSYTRNDFIPMLKTIANLGLGQLDKTVRGRLKGIKNLKITMQSIGAAACGQQISLKSHSTRNKYDSLPIEPFPPVVVPKPEVLVNAQQVELPKEMNLRFFINGKPLQVLIPKGLTPAEIASLISKLVA